MERPPSKLYAWALRKANSPHSTLWVGLLFFLEIILFIPLDAVLMFFCLQNRRKIFAYVAIAALASTLSGSIGYLLGHFLWDLIGPYVVPNLVSASLFERLSSHFIAYESWAIFLGGALPFPLKALSLTAGVFKLGLLPFMTFFFMARLVRFCIVGGMTALWGEQVKGFVERHFHRIIMVIGAKFAIIFLFFWALAK
jgi:membrane protein YqaA with SNARE-associated domain